MYHLKLQLNKKIALLSAEMPFEFIVLRQLTLVAAILIVIYLYFVSASVLNVIAQRETEQASATLETDMGILEGRYFELAGAITQKRAEDLGLSPITATAYVYRPTSVSVATIGHDAI